MKYVIVKSTIKYYKNKTGIRYCKYDTWTQPVLTSNTSYGTVSASSAGTDFPAYKALDGSIEGASGDHTWWEMLQNINTGNWKWDLPEEIIVTGIRLYTRGYNNTYITGRFYTDSTKNLPIGDAISTSENSPWASFDVQNIPIEGVRTRCIYFDVTGGSSAGYVGIGELVIDATLTTYKGVTSSDDYDFVESYTYAEEVKEGEDYDFTKEVLTPYVIVRATTKYYKNKVGTRYYKYDSWTQPILTSNTTSVAEGNIVCTASSWYQSDSENNQPYNAMDGVKSGTSNNTYWGINNSVTGFWQVKFPYKLRIKGLTYYNRYSQGESQVVCQGRFYTSNAKTTPIGNAISTSATNWQKVTISGIPSEGIETDTIYFDKTGGTADAGIGELDIVATLTTYHEVASTDDYDFIETYTYVEEVSENDDYDYLKHGNASYVCSHVGESISVAVTLKLSTGTVLTNKTVTINGISYTTDANGQVILTGEYGSPKAYYVQWGNYSIAQEIVFDGTVQTIELSADFEIVTIKKADNTIVANKTVTIGGNSYTTNSSGQVTLTGDYNTSKSLLFKLDNNNYKNVTITFKGGSTTVTLEAHVVAGKVSVTVWNYSSSNWGKKAYSFTVPTYVKIIKMTGSGFDGWSDESSDKAYVGTSSKSESAGGTVIFYGTGSFTKYVGVTAGKTYTLYGRWISNAQIEYSDTINKQTANVTLS